MPHVMHWNEHGYVSVETGHLSSTFNTVDDINDATAFNNTQQCQSCLNYYVKPEYHQEFLFIFLEDKAAHQLAEELEQASTIERRQHILSGYDDDDADIVSRFEHNQKSSLPNINHPANWNITVNGDLEDIRTYYFYAEEEAVDFAKGLLVGDVGTNFTLYQKQEGAWVKQEIDPFQILGLEQNLDEAFDIQKLLPELCDDLESDDFWITEI
jgi:hypothetical protein